MGGLGEGDRTRLSWRLQELPAECHQPHGLLGDTGTPRPRGAHREFAARGLPAPVWITQAWEKEGKGEAAACFSVARS